MQLSRRAAFFAASLSVLALAGCHHSASDGSGQGISNSSLSIATINGQAISKREFYNQLQGYRPTQQTIGLPVGQTVLRQLINGLLIVQLAQKQGVAPTQAQVSALYTTQEASANAQSIKPFSQLLADNGFTPQDVMKYQIEPQLATINLIEKNQPPVTDAAISTYYTKNIAHFTEPDRAHIQRIIVSNAADAQRIYGQLQKGQAFATLVSQSIDHAFPNGDVPYWINLDAAPNPQLVPPALLPALNKATPGTGLKSIIPPYFGEGVYWIVQVLDKEPKTVIPESQVKEFIRFSLMAQRVRANPAGQQALQQALTQFQSSAQIMIPSPRYAPLLASLTAPPPPTPALSVPGASAPSAPTTVPGG